MIEKKKIKVVAIGDSMTDTFGKGMPRLAEALATQWPDKDFEVVNYGVGGTRVGYGLWRLTNEYEHWDTKHQPLVSLDPDLVILESFAYNNATDGVNEVGISHFRDMHTKIVETLRERTNAEILCVATIAPDCDHFLESVPPFFNTPVPIRRRMAKERMDYLEEFIKLVEELNLPVADVYHKSLDNVAEGIPLSTNITPVDWIHPGDTGHQLIASVIVDAIKNAGIV